MRPDLETLSANFLIKDSPTAVAVLDRNMCFISHSQIWRKAFCTSNDSIIGKSYYELLPDTPEALKQIHRACLKGAFNNSKGEKFTGADGTVQWLKWKINAWKGDSGKVGGLIIIQEDITEDKRREELLHIAERVARIGGWEVDMATSKVYWTEVTKEIHEVPEEYVPNLDEGINFYKEGEHRDAIRRFVSEAMQYGTPWDVELIIVTQKNKEVWVRAKGEAEIINGSCVRIYGTFQDIDERKKTELDFQKTNARLAIATKAAKVGIWDYDVVTNSFGLDDTMYTLYAIEKGEFNGGYDAWISRLCPDDKDRVNQEIKMAILDEKHFSTQFRVVWPNGEFRHIRANAVMQRDAEGKVIKMIGTNWDITELKTTRLELQRSKESFKETFENSVIGLAIVNLDGTFREVNSSICRSLGYTACELNQLSSFEITHPEDLEKDVVLLQKIVDREEDSYQIEKRYLHKNSSVVHGILTLTAGKNIDGELSYFIAQVIDISERIDTEKKLTRYVDITREQNESLLNFAHIVSHNLRSHSTNLSMLSGFLNSEENQEERKNLLDMLSDASESLVETVLHLNDVVQIKVDSPEKMKRVKLNKTIKNVEKNLSQLLQEKNASCHINLPNDLIIKAVPAYLDSIFLNLFTNSIKYSSPERAPVIEISAVQTSDALLLTFSDNGLGIDLDRHGSKLFGMYKTFHRNKDAKGIGLFITKNQIEAMNGKIEVESTVNVGTTFKLYFDLATSD
ncbi:PAS domain S-box protein [Maribacter sp.]|nr:PAS domain S-box protein [Maribacter sp.]